MKRLLDIIGSATLLVLLSPFFLGIALTVWVALGKPVLFRHTRAAKGGHPFVIYKFRTMLNLRDEQGQLLPDQQRMHPVGVWLRRFSLDEIPQLWNVLCGDMSLVGPRPLPMKYLARYTKEQSRRSEVRPGITGWAQINGRNSISWEEKLALDIWYVEHASLRVDFLILFKTLHRAVRADKVSSGAAVTMTEFLGSELGTNVNAGNLADTSDSVGG